MLARTVSDSLFARVIVAVPEPLLPVRLKEARLIRCSSASAGLMESHAAARRDRRERRRGPDPASRDFSCRNIIRRSAA